MTVVDARLEQLTKYAGEATCVRRIDERLINKLLINLPPNINLDNLVRHPLPEPSRYRAGRSTKAAEQNKKNFPNLYKTLFEISIYYPSRILTAGFNSLLVTV